MSDKNTVEANIEAGEADKKNYDLGSINDQVSMFRDKLEIDDIKDRVEAHVEYIVCQHGLEKYFVVLLFDQYKSIAEFHSNKIYRSIAHLDGKKDILMFIESSGGQIEPAYLISKTCKRLAKKKFSVAIARRAKSAATLISLGASEIHMGLLSELGPIDPQFGGFPALGLANAVEKIAEMTERIPSASDMLAKYLTNNVSIRDLGYFERINESAAQYAIRLLNGKSLPDGQTCETLAGHFTNHYKDHGFVIDSDEASELLGREIIKEGTPEYQAANEIYEFLYFIDFLFGLFKEQNIRYVGEIRTGFDVFDKNKQPNN
ncbi:ATP-dependent Clp protease proteolytic subunit [Porticoccaceae bacterium]|nr:ATP-dependent Clp protease proteolytic subunit [Porticoccaceae bacterium]